MLFKITSQILADFHKMNFNSGLPLNAPFAEILADPAVDSCVFYNMFEKRIQREIKS